MTKSYKFHGKITYKIIQTHPDYKYVKNPDDEQFFEDSYTFSSEYFEDRDAMISYIKHDLALVAGGGYDTENIYGVIYDITEL